MALKIEKVWTQFVKPLTSRKKDVGSSEIATDSESKNQSEAQLQQEKSKQEQPPTEEEQTTEPTYTREELEAAVKELCDSPTFAQNGMSAEIVMTQAGLGVIIKQASGMSIKQLSQSEFFSLHKTLAKRKDSLGGILDQRF